MAYTRKQGVHQKLCTPSVVLRTSHARTGPIRLPDKNRPRLEERSRNLAPARLITNLTCPELPLLLSGQRQPTSWFRSSESVIFSHIVMLDAHSRPLLRVLCSSIEETNPLSTRYRDPCLMTTTAPELQQLCSRKRRRGVTEEEHSTIAATSPQPPWKRAKRPFQSRQEADTKYWDSLSEIPVTRRAVKQLNQRNRQKASLVRTGLIRRPDRSGEPAALKNCPPQLKRFARHGGPDLRDLRGVSFALLMSRPLLTVILSVSRVGDNQLHLLRNALKSVYF